jgi:hypothetical protein
MGWVGYMVYIWRMKNGIEVLVGEPKRILEEMFYDGVEFIQLAHDSLLLPSCFRCGTELLGSMSV